MASVDSKSMPGNTNAGKRVVIGLYGVPGSGKTTLLRELKGALGDAQFSFYEGSEVIASLVPGGLEAFKQAPEDTKTTWRQVAVREIGKKSATAAIITGHFMFWPEGENAGQTVWTHGDLETYTHIVYLDMPPERVEQWRRLDTQRARPPVSVEHLRKWQRAEKTQLRRLCHDNGIMFCSLSDPTGLKARLATMLLDFQRHRDEPYNLSCAQGRLDEILGAGQRREKLETALVLDADRTLAAEDTGVLFWEAVERCSPRSIAPTEDDRSLNTIFKSGYTYAAFRQAMLLYEEEANDDKFNAICEEVASRVTLHPEMLSLLRRAGQQERVVSVVVTCGLRRVWEFVLARAGLEGVVSVVGGGRIADGFVVTPEVKRALAARLRDLYGLYVWVFGDSPLDIPMMREAHRAVVVVGEERSRSRSMEGCLRDAIDEHGLRAYQVLIPSNTSPRLDTDRLPVVRLTDPEFLDAVVCQRDTSARVVHATGRPAAKLLMTPTRDATVAGPALRAAHSRVGWYLATELLSRVVGMEEYPIPHVLGHSVSGFRFRHEEKTTIVAAMRGGEPMALGLNDALPLASFVHASDPRDLKPHHLKGQRTVVLVDSVVNNGTTVAEFVDRIRGLDAVISVVVVAGVVQARSLSRDSALGRTLERDRAVSLVALRLSENKFTGRGATDTGNRLFNTTRLP